MGLGRLIHFYIIQTLYMDNTKGSLKFHEYFKDLYGNREYLDKYGIDLFVTSIALFIFFIAISYFYVMSKVEPIKAEWDKHKCNPAYMPFAGQIIRPTNQSQLEFTATNFTRCVNQILAQVVAQFLSPIYYLTDKIVFVFKQLLKSVDTMRYMMTYIRLKFQTIVHHIMNKILNVFIPMQKLLIKFKDALAKVVGVATAGLYTAMGAFMALKSFMGSFLTIIIAALVLAVAAIIALWILPFTWPAAAAGTVFFLLISIPTAIIAGWMGHILNLTSRAVPGKPGKPSCFDKNTLIETKNGEIPIKKIKPGTILKNGSKVNATFKCALNNQKMYNINGIIVSESHKIFHDKLGWVFTRDYPDAIEIKNYREQYIYCLNTNDKRMNIKNMKFLDWDELEPIDIIKLKNLNYLSHNCSLSKIHTNLESGLSKDTKIELIDGHVVYIKDIKVNDHLRFGERVCAIVKIDTKEMKHFKIYNFKENYLIGGPNITIDDWDLGKLNTLHIFGTAKSKDKYLYHLVTDTGKFTANGIKIHDYNGTIENIIDKKEELLNSF